MRIILISIGLLLFGATHAQKHDNNWIWGWNYQPPDTLWRGNGQADWFGDTIKTYGKTRNTGFYEFAQTYSDAVGNLLYFSNGNRIQDSSSQVIINGDSLNFGPLWQSSNQYGSNIGYSAVQIPKPLNDSVSIMVHEIIRSINTMTDASLAHTEITTTHNGVMYVTFKNKSVSDIVPAYRSLYAAKHGNGRDWWILYRQVTSNCIVKILLTPDTIVVHDVQCIGDSLGDGDGINAVFSPDGSKYATGGWNSNIDIYDFDRCTGQLSNRQFIPPPLLFDTAGNVAEFPGSIQFSPDNQQLYLTIDWSVLQYHLNSPNFPFDRDTVAVTDGFIDTIPGHGTFPFAFSFTQYAPDGKIYIATAGHQRYLCNINNPNGVGAACDFGMRSVTLPKWWRYGMPHFPNYRLGRLIGSACDTVYSDVKPIYKDMPWLKVYPNPASDEVKLDYNWVEWEKISDCELRIADLEGRIVLQQKVPRYSTRQEFSVKGLSAGVYTVAITDSEKKIAVCKLTKVE